tara:strand:- start:109 stop:219 length:111 start_codon:yes stop_codon:yes gene_type:complete
MKKLWICPTCKKSVGLKEFYTEGHSSKYCVILGEEE